MSRGCIDSANEHTVMSLHKKSPIFVDSANFDDDECFGPAKENILIALPIYTTYIV